MFYIKERDGVKILGIEEFDGSGLVRAGFTTRIGGVSRGPFSELNMGLHVGDAESDVAENRRRAANALGSSAERMVAADQVHENRVYKATKTDAGRGSCSLDDALKGYDALVTSDRGILLSAFFGDCVPIFILDPINAAIGLAHAGWRGTSKRIGPVTLKAMSEEYGTDPNECLVAIGPAIRGCCYRVGHEVSEAVRRARPKHEDFGEAVSDERKSSPDRTRDPEKAGSPDLSESLDLPEENRIQLQGAGVRPERIIVAHWCTSCSTDLFYSHRSEGGRTGRMAALFELI